jgi:hypothetical protein
LNIEAPPGKGSSAVRILGNSFSPLQPFRKWMRMRTASFLM